ILSGTGTAGLAEGCLSVPGIRVEIPRMGEIDVEAQDLDGKPRRFVATELMAIVIQHEMDHLDGRLIVDWAAKGCPMYREEDMPKDTPVLD
ncbi:MAG TPA: peptide deformylase, partial [bacterium]|nr:peptide deformylase [bacterium]